MHRPARGIAAILLAATAFAAQAQTCATPLALTNTAVGASTCDVPNSLPLLPTGQLSPQPDYVTSFHAGPALSGYITVAPDFDAMVVLTRPPCGNAMPAIFADIVPARSSIDIQVNGLAQGQYLLVVTAVPDSPADSCGSFALSPHTSHDDDYIFADDFED